MQYTIELQTEHLIKALETIRLEITTPSKILGSIGEELFNVNRARHDAGLAPDGTKWKELVPASKLEKRKGGILYKTGRMLDSFNYQVNGDVLTLGFDEPQGRQLAGFHHAGTKPYKIESKNGKALKFAGIFRKSVNHPGLPSRPLIGFPESDKKLVTNVIEDHLMLVLNRIK